MKKTNPLYILLATGALVSTTANAAQVFSDDQGNSLDVTGRIYVNNKFNVTNNKDGEIHQFSSEASRFGLKAKRELDESWELVGQYEMQFPAGESTDAVPFKARRNYLKLVNTDYNVSILGGKDYSPIYNSIDFLDFEAWNGSVVGVWSGGHEFSSTGSAGEGKSGAFYGTGRADDMISVEYNENGLYAGLMYQMASNYSMESDSDATQGLKNGIQYNRENTFGLGLKYSGTVGENQSFNLGAAYSLTELKQTKNKTSYMALAADYNYNNIIVHAAVGILDEQIEELGGGSANQTEIVGGKTQPLERTEANGFKVGDSTTTTYSKYGIRYEGIKNLNLYASYQDTVIDYANLSDDSNFQEVLYGAYYTVGPVNAYVEYQDEMKNEDATDKDAKGDDIVYVGAWLNL